MQETEIKLFVPDLPAVEARLRELGATLAHARVFEKNVRYDDSGRGLSAAGRVLRLRQDDDVRLTFKDEGRVMEGGGPYTRFEAELSVSDFATMEIILGRLGYHPYMIYEKYRTTWALAGVEVMLDEMPYGHFVEIEGEGSAILAVTVQLGLGAAPRMTASYGVLFDRVKAYLGLSFADLTFANFAGINVPLSALT